MKPSNDKEAITLILEGLEKAGWRCFMVQDDVWDQDPDNNVRVASVEEAVETVTGVDEAFAYLSKNTPPGPDAYIYFVLGNDPEEVAADYTTNLDPDLSAIVDPWW